jgi:hypothetical protein
MAEHLAVLKAGYLDAILTGAKTVESRLARVRTPPYHAVEPGDVIWFKVSRGPVLARATAGTVRYFDDLTPARIKKLKSRYGRDIMGTDEFWAGRLDCRYATLIWLEDVHPVEPFLPKFRLAGPWLVLKGRKIFS